MADADWGGQPGSRLGLDIGGTLAKLVFFESESRPSWCNGRIAEVLHILGTSAEEARESLESGADFGPHEEYDGKTMQDWQQVFARQRSFGAWGEHDRELSLADDELGGRLHFLTFRSDHMERFVALMEKEELQNGISEICCTGGGAYKYAAMFKDRLDIELRPVDELAVVVQGIAWLVERPVKEMIWLEPLGNVQEAVEPATPRRECLSLGAAALYPFLLVNIGSGVSIVKVNGLNSFERVSGSAIGGGTFWGLCRLLCPDCSDFAQAGQLAQQGDASSVNLLVEDIYGGDYTMSDGAVLPGSLTASFFAKAATAESHSGATDSAAVVHALTKMVSSNICQIAYLNAKMHSVKRIVFTGNFLRQNPVAREAISENMRRVSAAHRDDPFRALFLQHEGYFGALGSFLHNVKEPHRVPASRRAQSGPLGDLIRQLEDPFGTQESLVTEMPTHAAEHEASAPSRAKSNATSVVEVVSKGMRSLSERASSVRSRATSWVVRRKAPDNGSNDSGDEGYNSNQSTSAEKSSRATSESTTEETPCAATLLSSPSLSITSPSKKDLRCNSCLEESEDIISI